jgi:hypothetical protein
MFVNNASQQFWWGAVVIFLVDPDFLVDPNEKGLNVTMPSALAPRKAR